MKYQELVDVYSSLEATTKRLEKTDIIADYLKTLDSDTIEKVGLLILGTVFPAWSSEEIGIGGKLVERAVAEAVGTTTAAVEDAVRDEGDIGLACVKLYAKKSQVTFFSQPLTIDFVFSSLRKLSQISGSRSTNRKIAVLLVMRLLRLLISTRQWLKGHRCSPMTFRSLQEPPRRKVRKALRN